MPVAPSSFLAGSVSFSHDLPFAPSPHLHRMYETFSSIQPWEAHVVLRRGKSRAPAWQWEGDHLVVDLGDHEYSPSCSPYFSVGLHAADTIRQRHGRFHIHAGGVVLGGGAVLLCGGSGAGKTITTLALSAFDGVTYAGADRTQVAVVDDQLCVDGHWSRTRLRAMTVSKVASAVANLLFSQTAHTWMGDARQSWDEKFIAETDDLGVTANMAVVPVVAAYDLRVLPEKSPFEVERLPTQDSVFSLVGSVNDLYDGSLMLLNADRSPVAPPFVQSSERTGAALLRLASAGSGVPRYRLRGSLSDVVNYLLREHS